MLTADKSHRAMMLVSGDGGSAISAAANRSDVVALYAYQPI